MTTPAVNFDAGLTSYGIPQIGNGGLLPETFGNVYIVDSNHANAGTGNYGSINDPFSTLESAIVHADAEADDNKGPLIIVAPNHAETITGAGGITADVAGLTIVGLGTYNQRPRFLMDGATTVDFAVTGADTTIRNLVFASGHADVVRCFNITASGVWLDKIEFTDNTTDENWLTPIKATSTTDNNADGLRVTNCRWRSIDAGCLEFIEINADLDDLEVHQNFCCVDAGTACALILVATGKDLRSCFVTYNFVTSGMTAGDLLIDNDTAVNTGIVAHNRCGHHDVTGAHTLVDLDGVRLFDNLSVSTDILSGFVEPAIDVDL